MKKVLLVFLFSCVFSPKFVFSEETKIDAQCVKKSEHEFITYVLVDLSDPLAEKDNFKKSMTAVEEMLRPGERLLIGVGTGKASQTRILMDLVKPKPSIWISKLKIRAQEKVFKDCLGQVQAVLLGSEEEHKHSALLETLFFVSKVLKKDKSEDKRLVLYSDMMQNSASVSFYGGKNFNSASALKRVEKEDLFCKLPDVVVHVAGAGGNISDKKSRQIEKFWESYFEKCGGQLEFYGPILLNN